MVNNHLCGDNCFASRTSDRYIISCFCCERRFNSRCFDLASSQKLFTSTSNALFLCYKCIDRVIKLKQNSRRSNDLNVTAVRNDLTSSSNNVRHATEADVTMSDVMSMLNKMDEKLTRLVVSNGNSTIAANNPTEPNLIIDKLATVNRNVSSLHAKLDHGVNVQSELLVRSKSMFEQMNGVHERIFTKSVKEVTDVVPTPRISTVKKRTSAMPTLDPLNWSFSFNQSTFPQENTDLYQLLHGFEQNTWTSFDYLSQKLSENATALMQIESICNELKSKGTTQLSSPVTDSIALDSLHLLNDKCDNMESGIRSLDTRLTLLYAESSISGHPTQHQCVNQLDSDRGINGGQDVIADNVISYDSMSRNLLQVQSTATENDNLHEPVSVVERSSVANSTTTSDPSDNLQRRAQPKCNQAKTSFYVTKFSPTTTTEMILRYMSDNGVGNLESTKVTCLVPRGKDKSLISFISFKIDTNDDVARIITSEGFWPRKCTIKEFVQKSIVDLTRASPAGSASFFQQPLHSLNHR